MKLYMAPLQSYTTAFYRKAHAMTFGPMDKYFTPFFEDTDTDTKKLEQHPELSPELNRDLNIVPQVATNKSQFLIDFTNTVQQLGYNEININMGCPFPMLVKRQKGGGLIQHPTFIEDILNSFFNKTSEVQLSVKMRLGTVDKNEGRTVIELLNQFPLKEVIIHPRLVSQKYAGEVDWNEFKTLLDLCRHPIIANGDINTVENAISIIQHFPDIKALMVGRGLLTSPDLPVNITQQITKATIFDLHYNYFRLITKHYNNWNQAFNLLQSFWYYPLHSNQDLKRLYRQLKKNNKPDTYQQWLEKLQQVLV